MKYSRLVAIGFALMTSACAVAEGDKQIVSVTTLPVAGANCTLSNKRGEWTFVTPADVWVKKSSSTLKAACTKDGWKPATAYLSSTESTGAIIGTVLLFGVVESAVDGSTGAGNNYPKTLAIRMKPADAEMQVATTPTTASVSTGSTPTPLNNSAAQTK
jgi:hypothetical protein